MKRLVAYIFCLITFINCTDISENNEFNKSDYTANHFKVPENVFGLWVSENYLSTIKETKSTKKASDLGIDDFYKIYDSNSIMRLNIHEGASEDILIMTSINQGKIINSNDDSTIESKLTFNGSTLTVGNNNYIKAPNHEEGLNEIVNKAFFSGKYLWNNFPIPFNSDGTISRMKSISNYEIVLDYNDAGMQYDKVNITFTEENEPTSCIYEFNSDTLFIYEEKCKTEEDNFCVEIEKGQILFKLIKQ